MFYDLSDAMNYSVKKIVEQGGQCIGEDGECAYSDFEGKHCAIGWLLDHYDEQMMESTLDLDPLISEFYERIPKTITQNVTAFKLLMEFHDSKSLIDRQICFDNLREDYGDVVDFQDPHWDAWLKMGTVGQTQKI